MALYYAPAFGVYLLARCVYRPNTLLHVAKLGIAVVAVFAVMWLPFCASPFTGETCVSSMVQGEQSDRDRCFCVVVCLMRSSCVGFTQSCAGSSRLDAGCSKTRWPTSGASWTSLPRSGATSTRPHRCVFGAWCCTHIASAVHHSPNSAAVWCGSLQYAADVRRLLPLGDRSPAPEADRPPLHPVHGDLVAVVLPVFFPRFVVRVGFTLVISSPYR